MEAQCTDGQGITTKHAAEGWTVAPDGRRILRQCRTHASEVITEYREKMGWDWTFSPFKAV